METAHDRDIKPGRYSLRIVSYTMIASVAVAVLYMISFQNYPLLHSGIELFSIVIACSVFIIAWNSRRYVNDSYFLTIGIAYLFIAFIDVLHTFTLKGIDIFGSQGSDLSAQLWLAARFLQAISLLAAPLAIGKRIDTRKLPAVFAITFAILVALVFSGYFPTAFEEESGFTLFNRVSEYVISLGFVGAAFMLNRKRNFLNKRIFRLLSWAIYVTIASELTFILSLYVDSPDLLNLIGHISKATAFYLVYLAIIKTALADPIALLNGNLKRSEEAIRSSEERLSCIIETNVDGIAILDSNETVVFANQAAKDMLSISDSDIGNISYSNQGLLLPSAADNATTDEINPIQDVLAAGIPAFDIKMLLTKPDGSIMIISENAAPLHDDTGKIVGVVVSIRDVTEQKKAEEMLNHLAYFDALTELPNRALLSDRLEMALAQTDRSDNMLAILYLDLDNFKVINDSVGHTTGDELIKNVAERLKKCLRKSDTIARIGSDEFVLVLSGITRKKDIDNIANKIIKAFKHPFVPDNHDNPNNHKFYISASMGISVFPADGLNTKALLKNAESALHKAKEQGKNIYTYYAPDMNDHALERLLLENDLRNALERRQFILYYQPLVDFVSNEVAGMEALIRWQHPKLGLIPPAEFIYIAERTGLINQIGNWVLREACKQNKAWQDAGYEPIRISVNISTVQFYRNDLVAQIRQALNKSGLDPVYLEIEITESVLMQDKAAAIKALEELRSMGVHVTLDDFGTGYSSLSYLKSFPIGKLKIDQEFIRTLANDPNDAAIVSSIITMARNLELKAVAEGVETERQFDMLNSLNCNEMQGYLFSRPLPAVEATRLLSDQQNKKENPHNPAA